MRRALSTICFLSAAACGAASTERAAQDRSFARLLADLSEPGGYFDTDNLISNEASYLHVMGDLDARHLRGGAYIGVGPDQNFSYIARLRPRVAVIVDIRRDNMLEHLLFKALFALTDTRRGYLELLLGLPPDSAPEPLDEPVDSLLARLSARSVTDSSVGAIRHAVDSVVLTFGVPLSGDDRRTIDRFHRTFITEGLTLRFRSHGRGPMAHYPTLGDLIAERDLDGNQANYLASDGAFAVVDDLQARDGILPVTGDFAGPHTLRAVGRYLGSLGLEVTAFYTSNVEFYLVRGGTFDAFVENVATLPRAPRSMIIRSVFRGPFGRGHPRAKPGYASVQLVQDLELMLDRYREGRLESYWDLVTDGVVP